MKETFYQKVKIRLPANIYFGKEKKPTNLKIVSIVEKELEGASFVVANIDTGDTMPINVRYWPDGWSFSNR